MTLLRFLLRNSWARVILATAIGLVGGACNAGLLALINSALHNTKTLTVMWALGFVGLALTRVGTAAISQYLLSVLSQRSMTALRRDLCRRILAAPLRRLEELGAPRLLVALTEDVIALTLAFRLIPSLAVDVTTLIGCFVYLGWLSWRTLLAVMGVTAVGLLCQRVLFVKALRFLRLAREDQDTLFRHFRALTEGVKELRMHRQRRETFFSHHIHPVTEAFERHNVSASIRYIIAHAWNQLFLVILVGLVLLASPFLKDIRIEILTGYIMTILYMIGPMRQVTNNVPTFGRANIGLQKIEQLGLPKASPDDERAAGEPAPVVSFKRLELAGVVFAYQHETEDGHFVLGPIDLTLDPGELVFVVGGNGSGKSTLVKLVTGLYRPEAGEIRLNGRPIADENREWYRQHFSAVFSDFYLFENLLGLDGHDLDARAREYLVQFKLDHKVRVKDGVLSTTALSQGQRKRLALLTAYLEDRSVYVFDEWAADQDPEFKEIFYTQLLPELRTRGKGVLVISHDDRYFHLADRIIKLDFGKKVSSVDAVAAVVAR